MSLLYDRAADLLRATYDLRVRGPAVLDPAVHFADATRFVASWPALRDEALRVSEELRRVPRFHELMPAQTDIAAVDGRDWRMLVLKAYGVPIQDNLGRCPLLWSLVQSAPDVLSATLSYLAPHKHIPRHRGPFRGVLRFHVGLSVPLDGQGLPAAVLEIDGIPHRIGDGMSLLWDDTYPHEVWNHSDRVRIALLLDVRRRRDLPPDMQLLSRLVIGGVGAAVRLRGTAA